MYQAWQQLDKTTKKALTTEDRDNIAHLSVMPQFKSLEKLMDNIAVDLENRAFREAQKEAEFLAIKWTLATINLIKQQIKLQHDLLVRSKKTQQSK